MADRKYEILVDINVAKDKLQSAFQNISKDFKALEQLSDSLNDSLEEQIDARQRLAEVTVDQKERQRDLDEEYANQEEITRKNAFAQLALANAVDKSVAAESKADANYEKGRARRAAAEQNLTAVRRQLTETIVKGKREEIQAEVAGLKSVQAGTKAIEDQEKKVEKLIAKRGVLKRKDSKADNEKAINEETAKLTKLIESQQNRVAKAFEVREKRVRAAVSAEVIALEDAFIQNSRRITQDKEAAASLAQRTKIQEKAIQALEREAAAYKKSGFTDKERKKRIDELRKTYDEAADSIDGFVEAEKKAKGINKDDASSVVGAFSNIRRNLDRAKEQRQRAFDASGRNDEVVRIEAELEVEKAVREAQAAREYIRGIFEEIKINPEIDSSGLIAGLPEIESIKAFLARDVNFQVEAEIDNASIARTITLKEGFKGLGSAVAAGMDDAGKGISNFDNLVRGLLTLTVALFFQQILITVVGLAAGLAALASSAIAAGSALGGALAAGALQAAPAIAVLGAFVSRITNVFNAVKQANLLQQQEASKSGQAANKQAKSLDGVVAAQERVAEAERGVTEARKKAREALEDLIIQEQRQNLNLEKSEENLQKAISSGGSFAVEQARLDAQSARTDLGRTRSDLRDRTRNGIEGSPEVTQAQKSLKDARRALEQARQSADQAGQSVGAASGKLDFLLGNLSNAEKRLYRAITRLQKTWTDFAKTVSAPLINSFTFAVNRVNSILKSSEIINLGKDIGKSLSDSFRQFFDFLLSDSTISRIANLGREFTRNLQPLTSIAINLSKAFIDIAELGAPALARILQYVNLLIGDFAKFTGSIRGKTLISEFFDAGTSSLIKFSELLRALGRVIFAVIGRPGSGLGLDAGNKLLDIFIKGLNNLAKAINTPDSKIRNFFERFFKYSDDIILAFAPILGALAGVIDKIFTKEGIENVKGFSDFIATVFIPAIAQAASSIAFITTAFVDLTKTFPVLKTLATAFFAALIGGGILLRVTALAKPLKSVYQYAFAGAGKNSIFKIMAADADSSIGRIRRFGDALVKASTMPDNPKSGDFSSFTSRRFGSGVRNRLGAIDEAVEAGTAGTMLIDPDTGKFTTKEKALAKTRKPGIRGGIQKVVQKTPVLGKVAMGAGFAGGPAALAASGGAGSTAAAVGAIAGPAGIILAVVAAVTALLAISGRLDDVWKAIKDTAQGVFESIKGALGELAKEISGEKNVKKAFAEIFDAVKAVGNVLAEILIPGIKILGVIIGTAFVRAIKIVTAGVRFIKGAFAGIKQFWEGIFDLDFGKAFGGLGKFLEAAARLIFDVLKAPFEAIAEVTGNVFKNIGNKIEEIFVGVINAIIFGVNKAIDAINAVTPFIDDIEKIDPIADPRDRNFNDTSSGRRASGGGSRRVDGSGNRVTRGGSRGSGRAGSRGRAGSGSGGGGSQQSTKADNENAENFLTSFNPQTVKLSDEITKKLSRYWRTLRREARTAANYVTNRMGDIRKDGGKDIDKFVDGAIRDVQRMRTSFRRNFLGIAGIVRSQMINVSNIVTNQMQNASMAVFKGAKYMKDALNEALDSVGSDKTIELSLEAPKIREQKAQGGFVTRADGGWIGNRGERGRDAVPALLGRGEAVLNWGQQRVVEPALRQTYGFGLDDMFNRTRGFHAGGMYDSPGFARGRRGRRDSRDGVYTASVFNDAQGYQSDMLADQPYNWAELGVNGGVGNAFGGVPYKTMIKVSYKGKSVNLKKLDIGSGGPGLGGKVRAVDIWQTAANALGLPGLANVYVSFNGAVGSAGAAAEEIAMPKIKGGTKFTKDLVTKGVKKMIDAANNKLAEETPQDVTGSGINVPLGQVSGNLREAIAMGKRMGLGIGPGGFYRPDDLDSFHSQKRAADLSGSPEAMARFFRWALKRYGRNLTELFYDPLGGIDNGVSIGKIGKHMDHVHIAFRRGGKLTEQMLRKREADARKNRKLVAGMKKYGDKSFGMKGFAQGGKFGKSRRVISTVFGSDKGFTDPYDASDPYTAAGIGYKGDNMRKLKWVFGEIGNTALGGLPHKYKLRVARGDKAAILGKYDRNDGTGMGTRAMDLWIAAARYLNNFQKVGMGPVWVSDVPQDTPLGPARARGRRQEADPVTGIVSWAQRQLGTKEGSKRQQRYASRFGLSASLPWCSIFVANALRSNGVRGLPSNPAYSGAWMNWKGGRNVSKKDIKPGDLVIYDWGDGGITDHIAIYEGNGRVIGGNQNNAVTRAKARLNKAVGIIRPNTGGKGLQKFAKGGPVKGTEGQAVPVIAHAGEWVLNRKQQNMVAGFAGTTADRLKNMLGFGGGPDAFAKGGVIRANSGLAGAAGNSRPFRARNLSPFKFPTPLLGIIDDPKTFDTQLRKFGNALTKLVNNVLSTNQIKREERRIEKEIKRLKKDGTTDREDSRIKKLKDLLKNIETSKAVKTLLDSVRQMTGTDGESGLLGEFYKKIKRTFDNTTSRINLAYQGLRRSEGKLIDIRGADKKLIIDPADLAAKEAEAQEKLFEGLNKTIFEYTKQIDKLKEAASKIGAKRNKNGRIVEKSLARLINEQTDREERLEKLERGDESKKQKKQIERLKKLIAKKKKEVEARESIESEINNLEDQRRAKQEEAAEAEKARLEARLKSFEEETKSRVAQIDREDAFANYVKSLGELLGNTGAVSGALNTVLEGAKKRDEILKQRLATAQAKADIDPRWQEVVDDLQKQVYDSGLAVVQAQADIIQNALSDIDNVFQRSETRRGISDRLASLRDKMVAGMGNNAREQNIIDRGNDLATQRNEIAKLLANPNTVGNQKLINELNDRLAELDATIQENNQELIDFRLQLRQQAVERITGISSRTGGLLGNAGSIFDNIGRTLGEPTTRNQISLAESLRTALGLEGRNLATELGSFLADPNTGGLLPPEATNVLQQLLTAFNSGDPGSFATVLQGLSPQIALLESTLGESARGPFAAFIDSLTNNTIAVTDNTANLAELNGLANQPQPFSTTAWTRFRAAIFNGLGDVLPQFDVPQMATGGYITKGGMFELHPGEFVVNANQSNVPDAGDINITVNEANKPLDVTALASRIAFEKRTRS